MDNFDKLLESLAKMLESGHATEAMTSAAIVIASELHQINETLRRFPPGREWPPRPSDN